MLPCLHLSAPCTPALSAESAPSIAAFSRLIVSSGPDCRLFVFLFSFSLPVKSRFGAGHVYIQYMHSIIRPTGR
jgi:hypothetical protein